MYPANGTVVNVEFFFKNKCKTNENISENTNKMINETLEKEKAKAKKRSKSPKPNVLFKVVFSLSFEYR